MSNEDESGNRNWKWLETCMIMVKKDDMGVTICICRCGLNYTRLDYASRLDEILNLQVSKQTRLKRIAYASFARLTGGTFIVQRLIGFTYDAN